MKRIRYLLLAGVTLLALLPGAAGADTTTRVSVSSAEAEATGGNSSGPAISADGRFVAFHSGATNLVAGDSNALQDVFVRDRTLGTTERVSVSSAEAEATGGGSVSPAISADGRFVAFSSDATNLVGDSNVLTDVFVRDRTLGTTERVSVSSAEAQAIGGGSFNPAISGDGRFVAFESGATNLVAGDSNVLQDVFVRDRSLTTTERVSVDSGELQAIGGGSFNPAISGDGRFVAFESDATNLVAGDSNSLFDVFARDRTQGTTERVSVDSGEVQATGFSLSPAISADGRFVAFHSDATSLVGGDSNGLFDVFVRDRTLGTTERVSVDSAEVQATGGGSLFPSISADGRFVAFQSTAVNLVAGDSNGANDVFARDRTLGTTERVSVDSAEAQATGGNSADPAISADGRFVVFGSTAVNLVAGDSNALTDIFARSFDDDGDLVHEYDDNCPNTANGPVQASVLGVGNQTDSDGDGVPGAKPPPGAAWGGDACDVDDDNDGKPDTTDGCRTLAEDYDGFEDADGCPDTDNDLDGILDVSDSGKYCFDPAGTLTCNVTDCRNVAEDIDAFKDSDGCPEPDNDNDGFADQADNCPGADIVAGADGMLGSPEDLNHNGRRDVNPPDATTEAVFTNDDLSLKIVEDYDLVLDIDGCHDSPGDDYDGDGYTDENEALFIGTDPGYSCGINGWPSNLFDGGISANKLDIVDVTSFVAPVRHFEKSPGDPGFSARWDIKPGPTGFPKYINITDVTTLVAGPTGNPPMLNGARAFGKDCPLPPQ